MKTLLSCKCERTGVRLHLAIWVQSADLHQIAGKYWVSCEQEGSMEGIMLKVDSHLLFHTKKEAIDYMTDLWHSLIGAITNETE